MRTAITFTIFLIAGLTNWCQSQELNGQILDKQSHPVADVQLVLERSGLTGNTDSQGNFHLAGTSVLPRTRIQRSFDLKIHGNSVIVSSTERNDLKVKIVDPQGKQWNLKVIQTSPGHFLGSINAPASGLFFIQIHATKTGEKAIFRFMNGFNSICARDNYFEHRPITAGATLLCNDTLVCTKQGFLRKRIPVILCKDSTITLFMYPELLSITAATYPVIDGSTSTQPVGIVLASTILGTSYGYAEQADGSKKMVAYSSSKPALADSINKLVVKHNTTHDAYVNVINGTAKLGLIARLPSADEIAHADSTAVVLDIRPFALDAFAFLVNRKNPVVNLSLENIKKIYTGEITNWTQIGGYNLAIRPYQREKNSGSQEMMISMVMKDAEIIKTQDLIATGMMGPFNMLSTDTIGIGYTVYFYGKNMAPEQTVRFLSVDDVTPTYDNIISRKYPLWADVYLVSRVDLDPTSNAAHIRDLILSPTGQQLIKKTGYVPIDQTGVE